MNPDLQVSEDARSYEQLAAFDGEPAQFWTGLCEYVQAQLCLLYTSDAADE